MANQEHLTILKQGVITWNQWRKAQYAHIQPDLVEADLVEADLRRADLRGANLREADLRRADLRGADLREARLFRANLGEAKLRGADLSYASLEFADLNQANLSEAHLRGVNLRRANLSKAYLNQAQFSYAELREANLRGADLNQTNLRGADLSYADLSRATLVGANFAEAILSNCHIYGISAWNVELKEAREDNLVITPEDEPTITVDNLEVAQFIYLLLNNPKIRDVIDTIARKAVLILGRFTPSRKAVLDALREALRAQGYIPILFDFDRPSSRNVTETVKTLAHLSRFIIADLTDPSSIPYELAQVVPGLAVPVQPVLLEGSKAFAMFSDLPRTYHWVLPTHYYTDQAHLLATLKEDVIAPAEQKARELEKR